MVRKRSPVSPSRRKMSSHSSKVRVAIRSRMRWASSTLAARSGMADGASFQRGIVPDVGQPDDLHPVPEQPGGVVGDLHPLAVLAPHDQIGQEGARRCGHGGQRRVELAELAFPAQGAGEIEGEQALVQAGVDVLSAPVAGAHQQRRGDGLHDDVGRRVAGVGAGAVRGRLPAEGHAEIDVRARARFDHAVVRRKPGQLPGGPNAVTVQCTRPGCRAGELAVVERPAQAGRAALGFEQHVGPLNQRVSRGAVGGHGRVEHDAARTPVPQPPGGQAAAGVASWRLDPNHLGSVVREQHARHVQSGC